MHEGRRVRRTLLIQGNIQWGAGGGKSGKLTADKCESNCEKVSV